MSTEIKSLTIRLPLDLYQITSAIATRRLMSFNALVQESLLAMLKQEEEARLYEAYGLTAPSFIKCEQVLTISQARLETRLGRLHANDLTRVATALRLVWVL